MQVNFFVYLLISTVFFVNFWVNYEVEQILKGDCQNEIYICYLDSIWRSFCCETVVSIRVQGFWMSVWWWRKWWIRLMRTLHIDIKRIIKLYYLPNIISYKIFCQQALCRVSGMVFEYSGREDSTRYSNVMLWLIYWKLMVPLLWLEHWEIGQKTM